MGKVSRVILISVLVLILGGGALASFIGFSFDTPDFSKLKDSVEVTVKLANGKKAKRRVGPKAPGWVSIDNISDYVLAAVISSEDASFYSHKGLDYHEIKEAIKKDLKEKRWARGASTLTQQLIKNVYFTQEKSLMRKVKEMIWAGQLEKSLTKSQILCFYLNLVEFGPGIYGVGNASRYYFSQSPATLSPKQAAFLAMMLPSPVKYHEYFRKKQLTVWATKRLNQILKVMNKMGYLEADVYRAALKQSLWGETVLGVDPDSAPESDDKEVADPPAAPLDLGGEPTTFEEPSVSDAVPPPPASVEPGSSGKPDAQPQPAESTGTEAEKTPEGNGLSN